MIVINEFRKLLKQKHFLYLILILIVANIGIIWLDSSSDKGKTVPDSSLSSWVEQSHKEGTSRTIEHLKETQLEFESSMEDNYYSEYIQYFMRIDEYSNYLKNVQQSIEQLKGNHLWHKFSEDEKVEYDELSRLYAQLENVNVIPINYEPVEQLIKVQHSDWFLIIASVLTGVSLCQVDEENEMDKLLLLTQKGRGPTIIAKLIVLFCVVVILSLMISVINITTIQLQQGFILWDAPVQSVPSLYESAYPLNIKTWFLLSQLIKTLVLFTYGVIYIGLHKIFKEKIISLLIFALIIGTSVLFYYSISNTSSLEIFKRINLFNFLKPLVWISMYSNTKFGFVQGSMPVITIVICIILVFIFILIAFYFHLRSSRLKSIELPNISKTGIYRNTVLIIHEGLKLLFMNQLIWVLVGTLTICFYFSHLTLEATKNQAFINHNKELAEFYEVYGGEFDDSKREWFNHEMKRIESNEQTYKDIKKEHQQGTLSTEVFMKIETEYTNEAPYRRAFKHVFETITEETNYLVFPSGYQAIFGLNTQARDLRMSIVVIMSLIFGLSGIYTIDQQHSEDQLFVLTKRGTIKRYKSKLKLAIKYALMISLTFIIVDLLVFNYIYPMSHWTMPFTSIIPVDLKEVIKVIWPLTNSLPIWLYFLVLNLTRLLGSIFCAVLIVWLSRRLSNKLG